MHDKYIGLIFENEEGDAFKYYHTPFDTYENFLIDTYEPLFKLVLDFVERYWTSWLSDVFWRKLQFKKQVVIFGELDELCCMFAPFFFKGKWKRNP